jgi:succinylglutamate desuccinylase
LNPATSTAPALQHYPRILGRYQGQETGPLVLCVGGIHGNEPSGVKALQRVFETLDRTQPQMCGTLVGLSGNIRALEVGARFIDRDLNRAWKPTRMERLDELPDTCAETLEQRELLAAVREAVQGQTGPFYFLDLHTSSAEGEPFACIGDTIRNRRFARSFPVPVILGLEEQLEGALLEHLNNAGMITMGFEAGQHDAASSVDHHEAAIWRCLIGARCIKEKDSPQAQDAAKLLDKSRNGLPQWLGVRYRHAISAEDGFRMRPGYRNFRSLKPGEIVADDQESGGIQANYKSRILLPLYQGKGNDGFFLALDIHPAWLVASRWMRRLRLDRVIHFLPGVRRIRGGHGQEALHVDRRVARWFLVEVFHLLGFRKRRIHGEHFLVERRKFDLKGPPHIDL